MIFQLCVSWLWNLNLRLFCVRKCIRYPFSCDMGLDGTLNPYLRLIRYGLSECHLSPYLTRMDTICISYQLLCSSSSDIKTKIQIYWSSIVQWTVGWPKSATLLHSVCYFLHSFVYIFPHFYIHLYSFIFSSTFLIFYSIHYYNFMHICYTFLNYKSV